MRVTRSELLPRMWPMYRVALPRHFAEELAEDIGRILGKLRC